MTGIANAASESTELIFLSHSGADTQAAKELAGLLRQGGVEARPASVIGSAAKSVSRSTAAPGTGASD